jgi:hypothetical protein
MLLATCDSIFQQQQQQHTLSHFDDHKCYRHLQPAVQYSKDKIIPWSRQVARNNDFRELIENGYVTFKVVLMLRFFCFFLFFITALFLTRNKILHFLYDIQNNSQRIRAHTIIPTRHIEMVSKRQNVVNTSARKVWTPNFYGIWNLRRSTMAVNVNTTNKWIIIQDYLWHKIIY